METYDKEMQILQNGLGFTQAELDDNRNGKLSVDQNNQLVNKETVGIISGCVTGVIISVGAFVIASMVANNYFIDKTTADVNLIRSISVIGFLIIGYSIFRTVRGVPRTAHRVSGAVYHSGNTAQLQLNIEGLRFNLPATAVRTFSEGDLYTIYYITRPLKILSAEPGYPSTKKKRRS